MRTGRNTALLVSSYLWMVHAKDQSSDIGNIISLTICALVLLGASYACYRGVYFFSEASRHGPDNDRSPLNQPLV
ncbi:MAG: hypothetical protein CL816_04815 [Coxiellaceae bacterium]|nr:hypothetical protein [Coxiellaceae bacterium]